MSAVRLFDGTEDTLEEIYLSHNMLGDNLNPVFSTDEFRNLKYLRVLDLSYNGLAGISEGLITGCDELKVGASSSWTLQIFYFVSIQYFYEASSGILVGIWPLQLDITAQHMAGKF